MRQPEARIGQLLGGKYRLERLLAQGGMGIVYGARHEGTGRAVAAKLLRPELMVHPDLVRRVEVEARLAVEAAHPNVVEVLDMGEDLEGIPYLILERLHGCTLEDVLSAPLPLFTTIQALVPVANALAALHHAGIVHRDIKPSNLFLSATNDGRITPKLLDFGIAKALASTGATRSALTLGTPAYMAPEQAFGDDAVTHASDVWSLAVVITRCLTGRLAHAGATRRPTTASRCAHDASELAGVPEEVARELSRALEVEPAARFARMSEFRDALLRACMRLEPERAWPGSATVSYAFSETALADWLADAPESTGADALHDPLRRGRGLRVQTRTLTLAGAEAISRMGRTGRIGLAALVVVSLGLLSHRAVFSGRPSSAVVPRAEQVAVHALAPGGPALQRVDVSAEAQPALVTDLGQQSFKPDATEIRPSSDPPFSTPTPASDAPSKRPRALAKGSVVSAPTPTPASTPRAAATSTSSEANSAATQRPRLVGANRSPIIE